jgi:hypothetical protein
MMKILPSSLNALSTKTNPHTLKEIRNNIRRETSTVSEQEHLRVKTSSAVVLTTFGQQGNISSICCRTGDFLLDFIKVIITANVFLASFTDC